MLKIILFTITIILFTSCGGGSSSDKLTPSGTQTVGFTPTQRIIADQFISIFENNTVEIQYGYAEDIKDGRGLTAGRAGFTSGTGDILMVIKRYTQHKPDNSLSPYIEELELLFEIFKDNDYQLTPEIANTKNLVGLKEAWAENSEFKLFRDTQDEIVDDVYFYPSLEVANKLGMKMPLSLLAIYDSYIQHGKNGIDKLVKKATEITGGLTPKDGADELTWLQNFVENRKKVLESDTKTWNGSINRAIELMDLIDAKNTQLDPFELRIQYPDTNYSDEVYNLPVF